MRKFIDKCKRVQIKDFFHIFLFLFAIIPSIFLKRKRPNIWLIAERKMEARDNGFSFFEYLRKEKKEIDTVYAINPGAKDYDKVKSIGNTVSFGTFKHWVYYLASEKVISSQKDGKPNSAICYLLDVYSLLPQKFYFLQHGITINDSEWLYYKNTKFKFFLCGAYPEYEYVKERFNYPDSNIGYIGFPRFDKLHQNPIVKNRILIMPSWREWIAEGTSRLVEIEGSNNFQDTEYFINWKQLLTNEKFLSYIDKNNLEVIFYPHAEMQKYLDSFYFENNPIKVASWKEYDIQTLLSTSELMITDYSSVFFDFVYMKKPLLFYQFDYEKFRKNQYGEGYFSYRDNNFGESYEDNNALVDAIIGAHKNNFKISEKFLLEHSKYFPYYDKKNCERTFYKIGEENAE